MVASKYLGKNNPNHRYSVGRKTLKALMPKESLIAAIKLKMNMQWHQKKPMQLWAACTEASYHESGE